jgi:hypothetical protein
VITTPDEDGEVHPTELVTVKVQVPAGIPDTVVVVPVPVVVTPPGVRVSVHVPGDGKLLSTTLPVANEHVGIVIVPTCGAEGMAFTVNVYVALAATHGNPRGLLVVTVITTFLPISTVFGV